MRWFILEAPPGDTPTPIIVTVVIPADPGSHQEPIIITVIATRPPEYGRPPTATLEPTPTQWWPPTASLGVPTTVRAANYPENNSTNAISGTLTILPRETGQIPVQPQVVPGTEEASPNLTLRPPEILVTSPF